MSNPEPTPRAVLDGLAEIDPTGGPELLIFADTPDDGVTVAAATPDVQLAAELRNVATRAISKWRDLELIEYGPAAEPGDGQLMWCLRTRRPSSRTYKFPTSPTCHLSSSTLHTPVTSFCPASGSFRQVGTRPCIGSSCDAEIE
jgi:hypothetical protein